jgi:hypothetical protein
METWSSYSCEENHCLEDPDEPEFECTWDQKVEISRIFQATLPSHRGAGIPHMVYLGHSVCLEAMKSRRFSAFFVIRYKLTYVTENL